MKEPKTAAEWQEAVDLAAAFRAIADCEMYGLIQSGHQIDVRRCDELLDRGLLRGVRPSKPGEQLAADYIVAFNASKAQAKGGRQ